MEKTCKEVGRELVPNPSKIKGPLKQRIYSQILKILTVVLEALFVHKVHNDNKIYSFGNVNGNALFVTKKKDNRRHNRKRSHGWRSKICSEVT
jgi:hypothetical protein